MKIAIQRRSEATPGGLIANGGSGDELDTFHVQFDPETESVVGVLVESVAAIRNVPPEELDPLADAIDPEALAALVESGKDGGLERIEFSYAGFIVTISHGGQLRLRWE